MHEMRKESKLPLNEQYIHYANWNPKRRLVVTMFQGIAKYFHQARHLAVDFTFKRVKGEMNQWDVATNVARFNERAILASIYCDKSDRETYTELFDMLFEQIERVTGSKLLIFAVHGEGVRAVLTDCEVPETQGLGDALVKVNKSFSSSPLQDINDPLILVTYVGKLCKTHFHRRIDDMKDVPKDVRDHLRGFPFLQSEEELQAFDEFCIKSPFKRVKDWWQHKKNNSQLRPMLNKYLSPMDDESWSTTPDTTNEVESAHAGQNKDTGIGKNLLEAILDAKERDLELLKRWEAQEMHGSLKKTWNYNLDRSIRSSQRRSHHARETAKKKVATDTYAELQNELQELKESLNIAKDESQNIKRQIGKLKESGITAKSSGLPGDEFRSLSNSLFDIREGINEIQSAIKEKQRESSQFRDLNNLKHTRLPSSKGKEPAVPARQRRPSIPSTSVTPSSDSSHFNGRNTDVSMDFNDQNTFQSDLESDTPIDESYYLGSPAKSRSSAVSTPSQTPTSLRGRAPRTTLQPAATNLLQSTPTPRQKTPLCETSAGLDLFNADLHPLSPRPHPGAGPGPFTMQSYQLSTMQLSETPLESNGTASTPNRDRSQPSAGTTHGSSLDSTPHGGNKTIECNPDHPEHWLTPNRSRTIQDAHPFLWNLMVDPSRLGRSVRPE